MKIDFKMIMIMALIGLVVALILSRGCGNIRPSSGGIDVHHIYDSIEKVIVSELPPTDTVYQVQEKTVVRWLSSATVVDTVYVNGSTVYVYNDAPIDTSAILTHYLTQAVTYTDTIRDSSLQAVILDTIFRNTIASRSFTYKILRPIETKYIDNRDRFQLIASFQAGAGMTYANTPQSIYAGVDIGLKFKSGTYFSVGYMAGTGHFATIRAGQVIRLRKR
jgi:hypothetical protein